MNRTNSIILTAAAWVLVLTAPVAAADLVYLPETASVIVPDGGQTAIPLTIEVTNNNLNSSFYLYVMDTIEGAIPPVWLAASSSARFLSPLAPSAQAVVTISVPEGTAPGSYTGRIYSKARSTHIYADRGTGFSLNVLVPSRCAALPRFANVAHSPDLIWPPNKKLVPIVFSGVVELPAGCTLFNAGYIVEDEYGIYSGSNILPMNSDRSFTLSIPVEAWRDGPDKDGRAYSITLYAEDELGMFRTEPVVIMVPHDQRDH